MLGIFFPNDVTRWHSGTLTFKSLSAMHITACHRLAELALWWRSRVGPHRVISGQRVRWPSGLAGRWPSGQVAWPAAGQGGQVAWPAAGHVAKWFGRPLAKGAKWLGRPPEQFTSHQESRSSRSTPVRQLVWLAHWDNKVILLQGGKGAKWVGRPPEQFISQ